MAKVFISYSRKDIDFAKKLATELEKNGLDFWVDWEGIPPTVDWWQQIEKGIEEADVFLFLISPDSAQSKICAQEIDTAIKNGKRLIPLVVRDVKGEEAPKQLGHINWIFFRKDDDFEAAFSKLLTAVQTDYEWTQNHRRLQVKALEWDRNHKEGSFLLRGKDLQDAESQLATNTSKEPHPTDLQREYVFKSRQAADRQRRITTGISAAGIIALAALAVFGFVQAGLATKSANEANRQAAAAKTAEANAETAQLKAEAESRIANSGRLALEAKGNSNNFPQRSLLLALEATYINKNANEPVRPDAEEALRQAVEHVTGLGVPGFKYEVGLLQLTKDDKWLVAGTAYVEGEVKIWNFEKLINDPTYQPFSMSFPSDFGDRYSSLYMSPQTTWLVIDNQSDAQLLKIDSQGENRKTISFQGSIEFPISSNDNIILEKQKDKVVVWQLDPEKSDKTEKATFSGSFVTRSEDTKYLITDDPQKGLLLWNFNSPSTAPILLTAKHSSEYDSFIINPKNNWLILFESTPREEIQVPSYDPNTYLQTGTEPWKGTVITLIPLGKKDPQSYSIPLDILVDTIVAKPKFNKDGSALLYYGASSPDNQGVTTVTVGVLKFFDQEFLNLSLPIHQGDISFATFIDENWMYLDLYDGNGNYISQFIDLRDGDLIPDVSTSAQPLTYTYGELEFGADGKSILTADGNQIDFEQLNLNRSIALVPVPETTAVNDPKSLRFILNANPKEVGLEETPSVITQSSDNNWLIAGGRDGSIRVWDNTVSWRNSSMPLTEPASYISLSNDNQWMAINNKLWKLKDGKPERFLPLEDENIYTYGFAVFSPDSHWLVYVEHFNPEEKLPQIKLIDLSATLKEDKLKSTIISMGNATTTYDKIQFSPNSEWLAVNDGQLFVTGNNSSLFIYNLEDGKDYEIQPQATLWGFSYTQDQQHMVLLPYNYYSTGENTEIWSLPSQGNNQPQKIGEIESAYTTVISKDGRWVLTIPNSGTSLAVKSKVWDTNCIIDKKECTPFEISTNRAGFSPDSKYLLAGYSESEDYASKTKFDVWSLPQDSVQEFQKVYSNQTTQYAPSIGNDGKLIIFGYGTGMNINSAGLFSSWGGYDFNGLNLTTYDGYGRLIFGGGGGGAGTVGSFQKDYSVDTFTPEDAAGSSSNGLVVLHGHESNISASQVSPDEKLILTYSGGARDDGGSAEMILRLWEIDKMRADPNTKGVILPLTLGADTNINSLAISPDSRWVYVITYNSLQGSTLYYFPTSVEQLETQACLAVGRNLTISEWQRYFPEQEYRKTCDNLPVHPSVTTTQ